VPQWPKLDGCELLRTDRTPLPIGTLIDRIGSTDGKFAAVVQADLTGIAKPASYVSRSLRLLGETPYLYPFDDAIPDKVDLRKVLYEEIYNHENDPDNDLYYVLKVKQKFYGKNPCKAAEAFGYPGGALQLELPDTVTNLLKTGYLEKLTPAATSALFGRSHPLYAEDIDYEVNKEDYFRPYSPSLYPLMNYYYTTEGQRARFRMSRGELPTPHPRTPVTVSLLPATVRPDRGPLSPLDHDKGSVVQRLFQSPR